MFKRVLLLTFTICVSACFKKETVNTPDPAKDHQKHFEDSIEVVPEISLDKLKEDVLSLPIPRLLQTKELESELDTYTKSYKNQFLKLSDQKEKIARENEESRKTHQSLLLKLEFDVRTLSEKLKESSGRLAQNLTKSIDNKTRQINLNNKLNNIEQTIYEKKIKNINHKKKTISQKERVLQVKYVEKIKNFKSYNSELNKIKDQRDRQIMMIEQFEGTDRSSLSEKVFAINTLTKEQITKLSDEHSTFMEQIEKKLEKEQNILSKMEKQTISFFDEDDQRKKVKGNLEILMLQYTRLEEQRESLPPQSPTPPPSDSVRFNSNPITDDGDERRIENLSKFKTGEDPLFPHQWHIKNTGQDSFSRKKALFGKDINPGNVYKRGFSGLGVKIAVSDTGLEVKHEDIFPNIIEGSRDYDKGDKEDNFEGEPKTKNRSHGTSVAGIIASRGWNDIGGRGIAPMSSIVGFNFLGSPRSRYEYIHQTKGPFDIFNYSYGKNPCTFHKVSSSFEKSLRKNIARLRNGLGPLYVKSAGNEFKDKASSCNDKYDHTYYGNSAIIGDNSLPYFIVVGAVNSNGLKSSYSNPGPNLWISAPGGEYGQLYPAIITTDLSGCNKGSSVKTNRPKNYFEYGSSLNRQCNYTSTMNGTSAAAPVISGVIAILLEANPKLSWRDIKHILALSATKIDDSGPKEHPAELDLPRHTYLEGWVKNHAGFSFHNWYGFGLVNLEEAVKIAENYNYKLGAFIDTSNPNNDKWYYKSGYEGISIPDFSSGGATSTINVKHRMKVEAVQVRLNIKHSYPSDIGLELYSPSGTKSILMHINSGIINRTINDEVILTNTFYGEQAFGDWTLKVIDGSKSYTGELVDWAIKIFGHRDFKAENIKINYDPQLEVETDNWSSSKEIKAQWKYNRDFLRYELSIGTKAGQNNLMDWFSVGHNNSSKISLKDFQENIYTNKKYYLNLRIIDQNENWSQIYSKQWVLKK